MDKLEKKEPLIGILNEHTLHLALKNYCEPDPAFHEQKYKGYVADIKRGEEIIEIETRSFSHVKKKLDAFLEDCRVTVVYPIAEKKWVIWIDPKTGELSEKHKSPKKGRPCDVFYELYKLKPFLMHENFRLKLVMAEIMEYKRRDGWSSDGKRGATREERIPLNFLRTLELNCPKDYEKLVDWIPDGEFTAEEFAKANKMRARYAWYALNILSEVEILKRTGKQGRAILYKRS